MIKQIKFKTAQKYDQFCIPNKDIDSGMYREEFEPVWTEHRENFKVEEFPRYGYIVTLPKGIKTGLPELRFDSPKNKIRIKEVFDSCQE